MIMYGPDSQWLDVIQHGVIRTIRFFNKFQIYYFNDIVHVCENKT